MSIKNPATSPRSDLRLGKQLSWLLRHGAAKEQLPVRPDGFLPVAALLQHPRQGKHYNMEVLQRIVSEDQKNRYTLRQTANGEYEIRANQGHSLESVQSEQLLQKVSSAADAPLAVHGTYLRYWPSIRKNGLHRMSRNHVHFANHDQPERGASGFRSDCEVLIYLDVPKVLSHGQMELYRSSNDVLLCAGIDGVIPPEYFAKVLDRKTRNSLCI